MSKRTPQLSFCILVALSLIVTLVGCGSDEKAAVSERLAQEMESVKDTDSTIDKAIKSNLVELSTIGLDTDAYVASWLEGYEYSISDLVVEGDTATATATITIRKLGPVIDSAIEAINNLGTYDASFSELTAGFMAKVSELMQQSLDEAPFETDTVDLTLVKVDGTWEPAPDFEETLRFALTGESVLF